MKIAVSGKHMNVGQALTEHVEKIIKGLSTKYFSHPIEAHVVFSKDHNHAIVSDIAVHITRGMIARAHHTADDAHLSFDGAADKLEQRLRRYKTRLRDHHAREASREELSRQASHYVLQNHHHEEDESKDHTPVVIAEMESQIPTLTVSEAVMILNLTGDETLVFHNSAHGELNVVHRRQDGNIGWVDPAGNRKSAKAS